MGNVRHMITQDYGIDLGGDFAKEARLLNLCGQ